MSRRASPAAGRSFPWEGLDEDRRNALLLYALIGLVLLFAFALIGYGYYQDRIAPKHETVLTVGDRKFDLAFLERRVRSDFKLGLAPGSATLQDLVVQTLQTIELEELARRAAKDQGVTISDEDIDAAIKRQVGLKSDTPRDIYAPAYRAQVLKSGLPVEEFREIVEASLVQRQLRDKFAAALPDQDEHVDALMIRTSAESRAREAQQKLASGEGFGVTAVTFSIDESKDAGGELGWVVRQQLPPKVGEALFTMPIGVVSEPIQDRNGWYLVMARLRQTREIDQDHKDLIGGAMFNNLIQDTRDSVGSSVRLSEDQIARIGRSLLGG